MADDREDSLNRTAPTSTPPPCRLAPHHPDHPLETSFLSFAKDRSANRVSRPHLLSPEANIGALAPDVARVARGKLKDEKSKVKKSAALLARPICPTLC